MSGTVQLGDPRRRDLDATLLTWMAEPEWEYDEARFETVAFEVFRFQFAHCPAYARFSEGRGVTPAKLSDWKDIPAVPTSAFKETQLRSFSTDMTHKIFRTSGTTSARRGTLCLDTLALYEASLLPSIQRFVFPEFDIERRGQAEIEIRILASDPTFAPDSSLSHMFGVALRELGNEASGYDSPKGILDTNRLMQRLTADARTASDNPERKPIALCGTSFAFVHLLEALDKSEYANTQFALPTGSRIMETGGFKGRSREVPRDELYALLTQRLGVDADHIVNQYGMTELGSQFYDSQLYEAHAGGAVGTRRKLGPPWTRVRTINPETGKDAEAGQAGMIIVHDLSNTGSVAAIQTADMGRTVDGPGGGFEVFGRAADAEARGCSLAADEAWRDAQP